MFYLIGIGLKPLHLTLEAKQAIEKCSRVFLDAYTSAYSQGSIEELQTMLGKNIVKLDRKGVEEGFQLVLEEANKREEDIALLVFGNALSATTHVQLLLDAKKIALETRVIAGISVYNFLGSVGLDQYRFGRTCTIVSPKENYSPESFYKVIESNFNNSLHSLCLLDIDNDRMMTVAEALEILAKIEKKQGKDILQKATLIGLFAMGSEKQAVKTGSLEKMRRSSYALFPQSLIVAASLNEKEKEALEALQ
jgi:diphthine synthase